MAADETPEETVETSAVTFTAFSDGRPVEAVFSVTGQPDSEPIVLTDEEGLNVSMLVVPLMLRSMGIDLVSIEIAEPDPEG